MSSFLDNIHRIHSFPPGMTTQPVALDVPESVSGLNEKLQGTLRYSRSGYVYNEQSRRVLWLKFLAIGVYLPLRSCASKCAEIFKRVLHHPLKERGYHDLDHARKLSSIAWKAVAGYEGKSLHDYMEIFALAELDYNGTNREVEMNIARKVRFKEGMYVASCMQPLFKESQYESPVRLSEKIKQIQERETLLKEAFDIVSKVNMPQQEAGLFDRLFGPQDDSRFQNNPFLALTSTQILSELASSRRKLDSLDKQMSLAMRCEKYAVHAIVRQQCCPGLETAFKQRFVEEQVSVECCGENCYRQQKICGMIYKVDCCATRCWAIDCLCCMCCFWPEGRSCCLIA